MQAEETQSAHRRHARRERARNVPHLQCKKMCSASAASIIASHGWRAGATYGTERMDAYRDVPFTPACSAYAVWNAVAVLYSVCNGVRAQQGRRYAVQMQCSGASGTMRCNCNRYSPRIHPDSTGFTHFPLVYAPRPPTHPLLYAVRRCMHTQRTHGVRAIWERKGCAQKKFTQIERKNKTLQLKRFCNCCKFLYGYIKKERRTLTGR